MGCACLGFRSGDGASFASGYGAFCGRIRHLAGSVDALREANTRVSTGHAVAGAYEGKGGLGA
eukprot:3934838-Rhodomonas_salina.1